MALKEDIQNIWSSDYVQKNVNKAYKQQYNAEYLAVAAYINGGSRPNTAGFTKMGLGLVGVEDHRRGEVVVPPPPTDDYTWRAATFNTQTDKVIGCLNRFQPKGSWWVPGSPNGTKWANGGGIDEITLSGKPGFRMCVTPEMLYPPNIEDSIEVSYHTYPENLSGEFRNQTLDWRWFQRAPSAGNPSGWANDWNVGEGYCLATNSTGGNMVGNHLYLDYGNPMGFRFGRTTGFNTWQFYPCPVKFPADSIVDHRVETKFSSGNDGFIRVWSNVQGSTPVQWVNYNGVTLPDGWRVWKVMETLRCPKGRHQTMEWMNSRVTIDGAVVVHPLGLAARMMTREPEPIYLESPTPPKKGMISLAESA